VMPTDAQTCRLGTAGLMMDRRLLDKVHLCVCIPTTMTISDDSPSLAAWRNVVGRPLSLVTSRFSEPPR
jgi:hypothetical protein